jgi:hypothetical protein
VTRERRGATGAPPSCTGFYDYDDGGDINWPSPDDQGPPDGALTGGHCAKKRWC